MALYDTTWYVHAGDQATTGYYAVAKRVSGAAVVAGQLVRQFTAPTAGNERVFVCIVAGTVAVATDATWVLTRGAKTTDGTATWMEVTGQASLNGDLTNTTTWSQVKLSSGANAVLGQIIKRSNNASYQICTTAGAMSASEPTFSDTAGVTTTDTTAVWTSLGAVGNFTGGQAPHARWTTAFGWVTNDNTIYIAYDSAEIYSGNIFNFSSSAARVNTICHNRGAYPPTSANLTTGASFSITGFLQFYSNGSYYFYGMTFKGNNQFGASTNTNMNWYRFDNCLFWVTSGVSLGLGCDNSPSAWNNIIFNNCQLKFDSTNGFIAPRTVQFVWTNSGTGPILAAGSFVPATLVISSQAAGAICSMVFEGLDLSQLTGSLFTNVGFPSIGSLTFKDCKLSASTSVTTPVQSGMTVQLVRSSA